MSSILVRTGLLVCGVKRCSGSIVACPLDQARRTEFAIPDSGIQGRTENGRCGVKTGPDVGHFEAMSRADTPASDYFSAVLRVLMSNRLARQGGDPTGSDVSDA